MMRCALLGLVVGMAAGVVAAEKAIDDLAKKAEDITHNISTGIKLFFNLGNILREIL